MSGSKDRKPLTSTGMLWSTILEVVRERVGWMDGRRVSAKHILPSMESVPVPEALECLPPLHPDRPRGSKAMGNAAEAKRRLAALRPGAWLVSSDSGWKWAKWPDGDIGWVPDSVELPVELRVDCRDDLQ
jgi:hypothetical protein